MTHRSMTICRVHTEEGIVRKAWAWDVSLGDRLVERDRVGDGGR